MATTLSKHAIIEYLQRYLTNNKARGMVAELALIPELGLGSSTSNKLVAGGWLLSPKIDNHHEFRYMVSVLPKIYSDATELHNAVSDLEQDRAWQSLATFMSNSGFGVVASGAIIDGLPHDLDSLTWRQFVYKNEVLVPAANSEPFASWPGNRGRPSTGSDWQQDVYERFELATDKDLIELAMRQAFFYGFLKGLLRKPVEDPYDVDAFVVGYSGVVMPVEIKEKSPTESGDFGIDAGRILMLMRLCLATDSNGLYVIREVDNSPLRELVSWRYITLSDIVMGSKWNLQAGGRGMTGGATQTVMLSSDLFRDLDSTVLSEQWLASNRSLQGSVRNVAQDLAKRIQTYLAL